MDAFWAKIEEILDWIYNVIAQIIGLANGDTGAEDDTEVTE